MKRVGKIVSAVLVVCILLCGSLATSADTRIRAINKRNIETLDANSKWKTDTELNELLTNTLNDDLTDTSNCEMVWFFPAEPDTDNGYAGYEEVNEWCLSKQKGATTNSEFLTKFAEHRQIP